MEAMKFYGIIYMYKNLTNGKVYIGQTTQKIYQRRREHTRSARKLSQPGYNSHFHAAIRKYGINSFKEIQLCTAFDKAGLDYLEQYFISLYKSTDKNNGYNLKSGGSAGKHNESTKRKIGEASKRLWSNPEHVSKMKSIKRNTSGLRTVESVRKSAKARKGFKPNSLQLACLGIGREITKKPVMGIDLLTGEQIKYNSAVETEKDGFRRQNISHVLRGKKKSHKGFTWRYI